ncbi:ATP-binding protein [Actinomadura sp. 6K520]|uniref:ATP-binding protein n=1 Tax=Actinomadura sp. 6K520 TaxID=2530364 RepID=UPI001048FFAD|nr:ATP-binding protein [Actinomadura sp. 6K520]TDE33732.1 hybrid sensor histidine kinase/response regulator [Actinomadura sp. 6K520]
MADELVRLLLTAEEDVFAVRQAGRHVAAALHCPHHDQVRVATALSELGRELYSCYGRVSVAFQLDRDHDPGLMIELVFTPRPDVACPGEGVAAAARLMDKVEEDVTGEVGVVRTRKNLPPGARVTDDGLDELRVRLRRMHPVSALEELRTQNVELIEALEESQRRREELQELNAELEQTNRGVMALYTELSEELEKTNQGVVALYAELDEKTDQLREAVETKNRFWASISHELRTPINGILGLARLLLDPRNGPLGEEQQRQVSLVIDTGAALLGMVDELLDMAKAEQGRLEPRPGLVDTHSLLGQLTALLAPIAKRQGLTLTVDAADAPPVLLTDEVMLTRVLRNLLGNALKFTDTGEVRLTVRAAPDQVTFIVADTGRGIPPADRERVFEEFYQVPGVSAGGTGLGLPYAQRLTMLLGGDLSLESTLGAGTTVTVRLPTHRPLADLGLRHVLIVGEETTRRTLRGLVEDVADRVSEAPDAATALDLAASAAPDLVLLGSGEDVTALPPDAMVVAVTEATASGPPPPRADATLSRDHIDPVMLAETMRQIRERRTRGDR